MRHSINLGIFTLALLSGTAVFAQVKSEDLPGFGKNITMEKPYATESVTRRTSHVGWADGAKPQAPKGFTVSKFAAELDNPRWIYVLDNGDVLVSEAKTLSKVAPLKAAQKAVGESADRITLLRDKNKDGVADEKFVLAEDLNQPFGMIYLDNHLYVGNTDGVVRFPFKPGQTKIEGEGQKILELPAGGYNNHWTRNLLASEDGSKIYVTVGSASNVGEHGMDKEERRANILEINPDGTGERVFASGLRNPNGMDWNSVTDKLWTVVNERDELGDDLVPDYLTSVREGGFYGWPYSYFGQNEDPRLKGKNPALVKTSIVPDYALGSHTASLGLTFYEGKAFPKEYNGGAFIGQRGSWNRSEYSGYKVVFVPFKNGEPSGKPQDFLTGFMKDAAKDEAQGRPVGVVEQADGSLLVADDVGNTVWHVRADNARTAAAD